MYYILSASSVTHQPVFNRAGFSETIAPLEPGSVLMRPDYKEYINPALIRRMSEVLRMSVACSMSCIRQAAITDAGPIIVGTGLGCLFDTEKFLNNALTIQGGMLPPTSFIQSTHNTIAGQISLSMENHHYNMTHTQNTLSFERGLEDAMLCLNEGYATVLAGGVDEAIPQLIPIFNELGLGDLNLTTGASFFLLSKQKEQAKAAIKDVQAFGLTPVSADLINAFLVDNEYAADDIDLVLYAGIGHHINTLLNSIFEAGKLVDYNLYCGTYPANSGFALHMAADILEQSGSRFLQGKPVKRILICNTLNPENPGLILAEAV